ncbi:hypothetical protein FRC11_009073, partial [Ceratobasidium sp. 423]
MMNRVEGQDDTRIVLHDLDANIVKSDIGAYMKQKLEHIPLTDAQWSGIIERCGVLFIYASTTCRYIEQGYEMRTLDETVNAIISPSTASMGYGDESAIDELYSTILMAAFNKSKMGRVYVDRMRNVLQTVLCAIEPMTLDTIAGLLGLESADQVDALLQPLRSVLNVMKTNGLVTTLHASFPDFMFSPDRSNEFCCIQTNWHATMAEGCLRVIDAVEPKFNICGLPSSHLFDDQVEDLDQKVKQAISPGLSYACRYWSTHLRLGEYRVQLIDLVHNFLSARLLVWMEVLNLTKCMRFGASMIQDVEQWCSNEAVPDNVARLARDAWQFVSVYASNPVSRSTPHIYVSMLPFWPQSRPVSAAYMPRTVGMVQPMGTAMAQRKMALLATWRISDLEVCSMSLSADGSRLAVATWDSIEVFDTSTGDSALRLTDERTQPTSCAFSPDGTLIAFGPSEGGIYLWNAKSGEIIELSPNVVKGICSTIFSPDGSCVAFGTEDGEIYTYSLLQTCLVFSPLEAHDGGIYSLSYSPDGLCLASGSGDKTVRMWDTKTGDEFRMPFEGHEAGVLSVTFSPDGSRLASASSDGIIWVWDPETGLTVLGPLHEHSGAVRSVAFSPDGTLLASGSNDGTIRVYNTLTGQTVLGPLGEGIREVQSIAFSPDGARLFSGLYFSSIHVWNVQDLGVPNDPLPSVSFPQSFECLRQSPSGLRFASVSGDDAIQIWDVQSGEMALGPLSGHTGKILSIDYSPNDAYIASGSENCTVQIWDAKNGRNLHGPMRGHINHVNCVRFSPDGLLIVSGSEDGTVQIWDVMSGQPVIELFKGNQFGIHSVRFSPNGYHILAESDDGAIHVVDRQTDRIVVGPIYNCAGWDSLEFSSDGLRILSCSSDSIQILDAQTGQQIVAHTQSELNEDWFFAALSPTGYLVAALHSDDYLGIWDLQMGRLVLGPLVGVTDDDVERVER